jgi:hypothetical protein
MLVRSIQLFEQAWQRLAKGRQLLFLHPQGR